MRSHFITSLVMFMLLSIQSIAQKIYYYAPSLSSISGLIVKEGHYNHPGFGETPDIDYKDTVFVLQLDHKISVYPQKKSDTVMSGNISGIDKLQIDGRSPSLQKYAGKKVIIKGLLMEDPSPANYYEVVIAVKEIKLAGE